MLAKTDACKLMLAKTEGLRNLRGSGVSQVYHLIGVKPVGFTHWAIGQHEL